MTQMDRTLVTVPVFNELKNCAPVLERIRRIAPRVVAIDDGSTDGSGELLERLRDELDIGVVHHPENAGYGRSMRTAFETAEHLGYEWVVTIDCDGQHEPESIPAMLAAGIGADIVSGSRYLNFDEHLAERDGPPPPDRRAINHRITAEINDLLTSPRTHAPLLGCTLTDSFCGLKAYRTAAVRRLELTDDGYAFPMQFWVQAAAAGLRVVETPVRLIYTGEDRSFGDGLDNAAVRYAHYRKVLHCELKRCAGRLPRRAVELATACPCG